VTEQGLLHQNDASLATLTISAENIYGQSVQVALTWNIGTKQGQIGLHYLKNQFLARFTHVCA
jgi:hypothetical protein